MSQNSPETSQRPATCAQAGSPAVGFEAGSGWLRDAIPGAATMKESTTSAAKAADLRPCAKRKPGRATTQETSLTEPRTVKPWDARTRGAGCMGRPKGPTKRPLPRGREAAVTSTTSMLMFPPVATTATICKISNLCSKQYMNLRTVSNTFSIPAAFHEKSTPRHRHFRPARNPRTDVRILG